MALRDLPWGYCRHCHRDEETVGGRLLPHDDYDGGPCPGSDTAPTKPPPEGTVSALTVSLKRARVVVHPTPPTPAPAGAVRNWSWPWGRH